MKIVMTTLLGIEAITAKELTDLGFSPETVTVLDGQVQIEAGSDQETIKKAVARCNVHLATAERVLLQLTIFPATSFEVLFDQVEIIPWETYIPRDFVIDVKGYSRKSKLYGIPACQRLIKKAIVKRLLKVREGQSERLLENPDCGKLQIQFGIVRDQVSIMVDTSGDGLHKRGYRPLRHEAPIRETLAAAMLKIAHFRPDAGEALFDPCCGSGTILIEAAMQAARLAPGRSRSFAAEKWPFIGAAVFAQVKKEAQAMRVEAPRPKIIYGSDLSDRALDVTWQNAERAEVRPWLSLKQQDLFDLDKADLQQWIQQDRVLVLSNPPYGERLMDETQAEAMLKKFGDIWLEQGKIKAPYRMSIISPQAGFEQVLGGVADKRRKLYNGMIPCTLYQYFRHERSFQ